MGTWFGLMSHAQASLSRLIRSPFSSPSGRSRIHGLQTFGSCRLLASSQATRVLILGGLLALTFVDTSAYGQAQLTDITSHFRITPSNERTTLDRQTRLMTSTVDIAIENVGRESVVVPLHAAFVIAGSGVTMPGMQGGPGTQPYNAYYLDLTGKLGGAPMPSGGKLNVPASFVRASGVMLTYEVRIFGALQSHINVSPTADAGPDQTLTLEAGVDTVDVTLDGSGSSDPEGRLVGYLWTGAPDPADVMQPVITLGPGTHVFQLVVVDAEGLESLPDTVTVVVQRAGNQPPAFVSEPLEEAVQYHVYYYPAKAVDPEGGAVAYGVTKTPPGMLMDPETAMVVWTPAKNQVGPQQVELTATDEQGASTTQSFTIHVAPSNLPPEFVSVPSRVVHTGERYRYDAKAYDPEDEAMTFALLDAPPQGLSLDTQSGRVEWEPGPQAVGVHPVTLTVSDPHGGAAQQAFTITVVDSSQPLEVLQPTGEYEVTVGQTLDLVLEANHAEAAFTRNPNLPNSTIAGTQFSFTPTKEQLGTHVVSFLAHYAEMRASSAVVIRVLPANQPPMVEPLPLQSLKEGESLRVVITASDPDGDDLVFSTSALPVNAVFNHVTREFLFNPDYEQAGDYTLSVTASDGQDDATVDLLIAVHDAEPDPSSFELVVDPPASPTFMSTQTISGNVVGDVPQAVNAPMIFIRGLEPDSIRQGRSATVDIHGLNTSFESGKTTAGFGQGITVKGLQVLSPTLIKAEISAASQAPIGTRDVRVSQNGMDIYSLVAFKVEAGAAIVGGTVRDPFTQQPIIGARVAIEGTNLYGLTDSEGRFTLEGVPPGAATLLITRPNYDVLRVKLAVEVNQDVQLEEPLPLNALARPPQPPGSLPRARTLASVLDRNVGSLGGGMSVEQAEQLIADTILVVGGSQVGLIDAEGHQLNPAIGGAGVMSLTPEGVRRQAQALIEGDAYTLEQFVEIIADAFPWEPTPPSPSEVARAFQEAVDEAWSEPSAPTSAMAIVLFNNGTSLSSAPPVITPSIMLNRFQCFLLFTSFLVYNAPSLNTSLDQLLTDHGIDPLKIEAGDYSEVASAPEGMSPMSAFRTAKNVAGAALSYIFGGPAQADEPGVTLAAPNDYFDRTKNHKTYERVWSFLKAQILANAWETTWRNTVQTLAFQGAIALAIGSSGGLTGTMIATTIFTAALDGIISSVLQKYVIGAFVAAKLEVMAPDPPIPESSKVEDGRFYLTFPPDINDKERTTDPPVYSLWRYTYQLYRFPNPHDLDIATAEHITDGVLEPDPEHEGKLRFVIPVHALKVGPNFFRIATVQYCLNWTRFFNRDLSLDEARHFFQYEHQLGVTPEDTLSNQLDLLSKFQDRLTPAQKEIMADLEAQEMAKLKEKVNLEGLDREYTKQSIVNHELREKRGEHLARAKEYTREFNTTYDTQLRQASKLHSYMQEAARSGKTSLDAEVLANVNKIISNEGGAIPNELYREALNLHSSTLAYDRHNALLQMHSSTKGSLDELYGILRTNSTVPGADFNQLLRKWLPGGAEADKIRLIENPPRPLHYPTYTYELTRFDAAGRPEVVTGTIRAGNFIQGDLDTHISQEVSKITMAKEFVAQADARIQLSKENILKERVGGNKWEEFTTRKSSDIAIDAQMSKHYDLEQQKLFAINKRQMKLQNNVEMRKAKLDPWLKRAQKLGKGLEVAGYIATVAEPFELITRGARVLYSQFSPAHMYVYSTRDLFPPSIEPHFSFESLDSFITEKASANGKNGYIVSFAPMGGDLTYEIEAGFPPGYLAVASDGSVYADNTNSNSRFAGRIFRFTQDTNSTAITRELAGTINYYSLLLQYGRPASPVAATVARTLTDMTISGSRYVGEELFIADIDAISQSRRVLRLPVTMAKPPEGVAPVAPPERVVGQPFVEDPEFRFSGPTDLAASHVPGDIQRMYMSDEDALYVIKQDLKTGAVSHTRLIKAPGRRWSGIAVDLRGNVFVADYNSGRLFYLTAKEALEAEEPGADPVTLKFLGEVRLRGPADIELSHRQNRLAASTLDGFQGVNVPVILEGQGIEAVRVKEFTKVKDLAAYLVAGGVPSFQIPVSHFDFEQNEVTLSAQMYDSTRMQSYWRDITIKMTPFGFTAVVVDSADELVHGKAQP